MLDLIAQACSVVFDPTTITVIIVGTICGVIFGALPGVSATMAVVIAMTFSYSMDGLPSIAFLVSVYCAAITGGGISAILFSIPGTPSSAVTTLDGYPMAKNGEPGKALGISLICSAIGGIFAACCMVFLTQPLAKAALVLGLVLGKMVEKNFRNAFVLGKGNVVNSLFAGHPIAAVLLVVCAILLFWPAISPLFQKITSKKGARQ